jgi:hypothetical protein
MAGTRRKPGQLGPQVEGQPGAADASRPQSVRNMPTDLGWVGRSMSRERLATTQLDEAHDGGVPRGLAGGWPWEGPGPRAMMPLLSYLRKPASPRPPSRRILLWKGCSRGYRIWLAQDRVLAVAPVLRYENTAHCFLRQQAMAGGVLNPAGLTGADVNAFLLRECGRISAG